MLRKIRSILALLIFTCITLLFLDFTGVLHQWFGWMAKIQLLPAILALNVVVIISLLILTLVFGRVYCSVICPLGVFQDIIARFGRIGRKLPYSYSAPKTWLRYGIFGVFVIALVAGISSIVTILAPYSSYGRMVNNFLQPVWIYVNNLLAQLSARFDSYSFYEVDVWMKSLPIIIVAAVTLIVVFVLAWRNGRTYCNTICPVGTLLGVISKFSMFKIVIDEDKCNKCTLCSRNCKASCIDSKNHKVDYTRCVSCMDCIDKCKHGAISYKYSYVRATNPTTTPSENHTDGARRSFLLGAVLATVSGLKAQVADKQPAIKMDGGLADIKDKKAPIRATRISPPGSLGLRNLNQHCTACQLCVSACPNEVLRPSGDLERFMQPEVSFERGYCRPECTRCSEVCPTGAITLIDTADKSSIQVGHAVWIKDNCIPIVDKQECGNCARHCPTGAIVMIPIDPADEKSLKIPTVNTEVCIGCGACENLCPSRPFSAIYVEGHERHRMI